MWILSSLALLVGLVALGLALVVLRAQAVYRRAPGVDALPEDVHGLRQEVAALRLEAAGALRHLAVVRYDAFGDMGGQMSWSLESRNWGRSGGPRAENVRFGRNCAAPGAPDPDKPMVVGDPAGALA